MGKPGRSWNLGSGPRIERKIIEKNRRTKMKNLYSQLLSLLPLSVPVPVSVSVSDNTSSNSNSKVNFVSAGAALHLADKIDEAVEHIKNMKTKLEKLRQKKDELLLQSSNKPRISIRNDEIQISVIEVEELGPNVDVVLADGLQNYSTFRHIIKLLHQTGLQIATANFAKDATSSIHLLHLHDKQSLDGATISRKLKELMVSSSSIEVVEYSQHNLWDYAIDSNFNWGLI